MANSFYSYCSGRKRHPKSQTNPLKNMVTGAMISAKTKLPVASEMAPIIDGLIASPNKCWQRSETAKALVLMFEGIEFTISADIGATKKKKKKQLYFVFRKRKDLQSELTSVEPQKYLS